jgi:hypothetical protein
VADLREFMAHPGESPDVIPKGFTQLLPASPQVTWVAGSHIRALEVANEDLLTSSQLSSVFLGRWSGQALAELAR